MYVLCFWAINHSDTTELANFQARLSLIHITDVTRNDDIMLIFFKCLTTLYVQKLHQRN